VKKIYVTRWLQQRDIIFIGWKRPPKGWVKLNYYETHKKLN